MNDSFVLDEQLLQRLPLPLAQLCRRSQNAKTPLERHLTAYYLWEAALKLLGATAVVEYAELTEHDPELTEKLKNLARPAVGHWWEFVRRLVPVLAEKGDKGFAAVRELVLGRARDDLPRAAGLYAALTEALDGHGGARATVRLTELFERLVTYRNREIGHGAAGQKKGEFYQRMSGTLLAGLAQVLTRLDVLAGRRMVYVADVRRLTSGGWLIERYALVSETPRRLEPLQVPEAEMARLPRPERVCLEGPPDPRVSVPFPTLRPLHPLVHYDPDAGKLFFLNARRGKKQIEYLCYSTGEVLSRESAGEEQRELLAKVLGRHVDAGSAEDWAARSMADEPSAGAATPLTGARSVGEFELLSRLGQGGMGVVYRAWQPSLGRQVALKCMLRSGDPKAEARFAREIRALGRIEHPNVVKVFTSGAEGDQWFYAMELIEGAELASVCEQLTGSSATDIDAARWQQALSRACEQARSREAPISKSLPPSTKEGAAQTSSGGAAPAAPPSTARPAGPLGGRGHVRQVVEIVRQVARAVHALHETGVVHRDIKPGNIMLTADGAHPVLMDLGLAQLADETDGRLTRTRQFVGTLRYASPEQVLAAGKVDRRTDVYSLGATLWELLTLRPAYGAGDDMPTPDLMLKIQTTDLEKPRKYNPHVPRDLEAIVMKCLEKDRARRYATAGDLADDLGRFLSGEPVTAQPPSFRYLAGKFARRYRVPLAAAALVLFLLGVGTLLAFLRIRSERNDAIEARHNEEKEKDRAQQTLGDLQRSRKEAEVVWNVVDQAYTAVKEDKIRHLPGLSPVHEELARIRLEGMQQLAKATPDDPTVEPKVARARAILGMISTYVGSFHRAEENLERAAQLYGQLTEKHPDSSEYRLQQCRALLDLGWLYWDDNRKPAARRVVEQTIKRLEPEYARAPSDPEVCYELGRGLALLGGCLPNDATQETREKLATRAIRLFEQLIEQKHREVDSRTGLAVATYRLTMARFDGKDQQGLLKSLDEISVLDEAALKLEPASPYLKSFAVFMHHDRADALVRLGKPKEALVEREAAVAKSREIVKRSPDAGQYTSLLAAALNKLGSDLPRLQRAADAQAAFEESNQIMDGLVRRFPDRAFLASQWLDCRNDLADLFEYGPNANGQIQARQDLQRTLDQAVQRGREFAARFPDHYWLQYNFAKSLAARGRYDNNAKRYEQALPYLLEAADVYRTRLIAAKNPPDADDVATYLSQLQLATSCSGFAGKSDEVNRLSQLALQVRKHCTSRAAVDDLGTILAEAAKFHREAGRNAEAIRTYQDAIDARSPAFEQATWHWYLRAHIGSSYEALADIYRQTGDFRNEVLANREYLKMIVRPWYGAKIEEYIDPSRPADEAEAIRIRELIKQATSTGMQHFTIPCDFSGIKYPFYVYVTNVPWPKHPLEDQARWLKEEKRGTIPEETMKEFGRLHKIAHENDVSFVDLCVYALGRARAEEGKQLEIENIGEPSTVVGSLETPGKAARDAVANLKARLVDLKTKLDNAPGDLIAAREAALLYEELGQRLLKAGRPRDGVEPLRESARLRELQVRAQPTATQPRQLLAATFLLLGKAHVQLKEFDTAYNCFHRRLDLLEQLQLNVPTPEQHSAIAANLMLFGELAELRGDQSEALRWYIQGLQEKNREAAARIANLLAIDATLAAGLTSDLQVVYARLKEEGSPKNPLTFVSDFAKEVETVQKAREALAALGSETGIDQKERLRWLADFAESYRTLAAGCLKQSQGEEALKACLREIELRHLILRLDSADQQVKDNYVRALLDGAKVSITLGQTSDGLKLLERGRQLGDENATFFLADLYTQGKVVTRDPEKATAIRSEFTFNKGRRLWDQKKYSQALVEFERSVKDKPSIDGYQRVGWCQRRLGRNEEAVAAFKKGIDLATVLNNCQSVVLDLVEAALSANKPAEVFAVLRMLEEKKWSAEGTDTPYTFERELTGMRAIALLMADKDASAAEKKLEEIVSRPNLSSLRSRNVELDAWLKGSRPSDARQAAVRKILATLGAPARELVSPYFPLKQGRTWVYTSSTGAEITVLKAARPAQAAERKYWLVETMVNGKVTESEQIAIELDGVYRQSSTPSLLKSNVRVLPLPARGGDSWVIKSRTGLRAGVNGQGATRVEDVTVPAGEFKGAIVAEMKTQDASGKSTQIVWYAKDVGPVKVVTKTKNGTLTWELKKVVIVFYQFDKSGKVKAPTAAELQVADADSFILGFVHGTMEDGRPYWAYVAIKPSKYREFYDATSERRPMVIGDYGKVVRAGFDKEVPADAKKEMEEKYGFDENYEENLKKEAKQDQELFLEQQEAKHIAAIVDMLKKKQGR